MNKNAFFRILSNNKKRRLTYPPCRRQITIIYAQIFFEWKIEKLNISFGVCSTATAKLKKIIGRCISLLHCVYLICVRLPLKVSAPLYHYHCIYSFSLRFLLVLFLNTKKNSIKIAQSKQCLYSIVLIAILMLSLILNTNTHTVSPEKQCESVCLCIYVTQWLYKLSRKLAIQPLQFRCFLLLIATYLAIVWLFSPESVRYVYVCNWDSNIYAFELLYFPPPSSRPLIITGYY